MVGAESKQAGAAMLQCLKREMKPPAPLASGYGCFPWVTRLRPDGELKGLDTPSPPDEGILGTTASHGGNLDSGWPEPSPGSR